MLDGCDIRIAGQDVGRGTFSHRYVLFTLMRCPFLIPVFSDASSHAMLVDQNTEGVIVPLNHALTGAAGKLELANSG